MKALSLWQPWASLVAVGAKGVETRSWATAYRGPLAIHAARRWDQALVGLFGDERFVGPLRRAGIVEPPRGAIVATCRLVDVRPVGEVWAGIGEAERAYGDYSPGRFAWVLADVVRLARPVPFRGARQLFEVPDALVCENGDGPR